MFKTRDEVGSKVFKTRDEVGSKCSRRDEVGSKCSRQEMRLVVSVQDKR